MSLKISNRLWLTFDTFHYVKNVLEGEKEKNFLGTKGFLIQIHVSLCRRPNLWRIGLGLRRRLDSCKQFTNVALERVLGVIYQKHLPVGHFCIFSTG